MIYFTRYIWIYANKERLNRNFSHTLDYLGKFVSVCSVCMSWCTSSTKEKEFSFLRISTAFCSVRAKVLCSTWLLPCLKALSSTPWLERISAVLYMFRAIVMLNQGSNEKTFKVCREGQIIFLSVRGWVFKKSQYRRLENGKKLKWLYFKMLGVKKWWSPIHK